MQVRAHDGIYDRIRQTRRSRSGAYDGTHDMILILDPDIRQCRSGHTTTYDSAGQGLDQHLGVGGMGIAYRNLVVTQSYQYSLQKYPLRY